MRLREELAGQIERQYGARYDPGTEITITAGATEALFSTITALVHPGDEVLLFEPCYDSYVPAVQLAGGIPVFATLRYPALSGRLGRRAQQAERAHAPGRRELAAQPDRHDVRVRRTCGSWPACWTGPA